MRFINLAGRKILVTGASSGIGRATAILLSQLGAVVILCGRNQKELEITREQLKEKDKHLVIPFDVTCFNSYEEMFHEAVADGIKLTGLVHCAGIAKVIPIKILKKEDIDAIFNVNYTAFMCLIACYARKKYSNGGSIVGVSAINAHYPQKCMSVYAASKGALEVSVKTLALELAPLKIRINTVIPGAVKTPMTDFIDDEALKKIAEKQLLGMEEAEQISDVIAYLLSDRSASMTGRNIYADGGVLGQ